MEFLRVRGGRRQFDGKAEQPVEFFENSFVSRRYQDDRLLFGNALQIVLTLIAVLIQQHLYLVLPKKKNLIVPSKREAIFEHCLDFSAARC